MKILFVDTYYKNYLDYFWKKNTSLQNKPYKIIKSALLSSCFGTSDFYSHYFKKMDWIANDIIINDEILQHKWAEEHGLKVERPGLVSWLQSLPYLYRFIGRPNWLQKIALAQIKYEKPDIVYMQDLSILTPESLREAKKYCKMLVGQIACPMPPASNLKQFDLIVTSFPHYVDKFRKMGIKSEYSALAFDSRVLKKFKTVKKKYEITFIGGISPSHVKGLKTLNYIANHLKIDLWGYGKSILLPNSNLYRYHHGEVWALDMYKKLAESKITINRHIDVSGKYANNMRLFEATGMGSLLVTDEKINLKDFFIVDKEIVTYKNDLDLLRKIRYYIKNPKEAAKIAKAGQRRTLRDHNYKKAMKRLSDILNKNLN